MSNFKYFLLNGEKYSTNENLSILKLVEYFRYKDSMIVLEYNNLICNKKEWNSIFIKNNDKIETITIVGGG